MRSWVARACALALASTACGPPTITNASIKTPGRKVHLVGSWGRDVWTGYGMSAIAFMPDGKTAVAAGAAGKYMKDGSAIVIFDVPDRRVVRRFLTPPIGISSLAVSRDGSRIATGGNVDGTIMLWDARSGARTGIIRAAEEKAYAKVSGLAFLPDGKRLVAGCSRRHVTVYDVASGATVWSVPLPEIAGGEVALSPDGARVAFATGQGLTVRDATSGKELWAAPQKARALTFRGDTLVAVGDDPALAVYDARTGVETSRRELSGYRTQDDVACGPGPAFRCVTVDNNASVTLWDDRDLHPMYGHADAIFRVAVSPDGRFAISLSLHDGIRVWDLATRAEPVSDVHAWAVLALAPSPDGARVASIDVDGAMLVRDVKTGAVQARWGATRMPVQVAAFSPDGARALVATEPPNHWPEPFGAAIYLVDSATARTRGELPLLFGPPSVLSFTAGGHGASVIMNDYRAAYDLDKAPASGRYAATRPQKIEDLKAVMSAAAGLPGGDLLVASGSKVHTWHDGDFEYPGVVARVTPAGRVLWRVEGGIFTRLAASRDGRFALAANREGRVRLLDAQSGRDLWAGEVAGASEESRVLSVALAPDGSLAVAGDSAGKLRVWDKAGTLVDTVSMSQPTALAFSSDGRSLFAGDAVGLVFRFAL